MKTVSLDYFLNHREADALIDLSTCPDYMRVDWENRNRNLQSGKSLCQRCNGTGNELFSMYRQCPECNGNGLLVEA